MGKGPEQTFLKIDKWATWSSVFLLLFYSEIRLREQGRVFRGCVTAVGLGSVRGHCCQVPWTLLTAELSSQPSLAFATGGRCSPYAIPPRSPFWPSVELVFLAWPWPKRLRASSPARFPCLRTLPPTQLVDLCTNVAGGWARGEVRRTPQAHSCLVRLCVWPGADSWGLHQAHSLVTSARLYHAPWL